MSQIRFAAASIVLLAMAVWAFNYNWRQHTAHIKQLEYDGQRNEGRAPSPKVLYANGIDAIMRHDAATAARYFRQAVSEDVLFIDSWIRLAEAETALGNKEKAKNILTHAVERTQSVYRWKWRQMLLARELELDRIVYSNANYLLSCGNLNWDVLQFLHAHFDGHASEVVTALDTVHLPKYLDWLMNWSMVEESWAVWGTMAEASKPTRETALTYANFLLRNLHVARAKAIWEQYTGIGGMTNPGFEQKITGKGFDWRYWRDGDGLSEITRVSHEAWEGHYAVKIQFMGHENIDFHHLYQIFAVDVQTNYRLSYVWKSQGITTDQGPFVEIYGYDGEGLYKTGPRITGTHGWHQISLEFTMPETCRAAVVRLRRLPSNRFDSKITGTLWVDDFQLEKVGNNL
jgi:hypothetical protein